MKIPNTPSPPTDPFVPPDIPLRRGTDILAGRKPKESGTNIAPPSEAAAPPTPTQPPLPPIPPPPASSPPPPVTSEKREELAPTNKLAPVTPSEKPRQPASMAPQLPEAGQGTEPPSGAGQGSGAAPRQPEAAPARQASPAPEMPRSMQDAKEIAHALKSRLREMDPEFGKVVGKIQVGIVLPRSVDQQIEAIRHCFGIPKTAIMSAAVAAWIKEVERILGAPIPVDRSNLTGLLPSTADRIMITIVSFEDQPVYVLNLRLPEKYDSKLGNMAYLLATAEKRTSKRCIAGSACLKLLDQLSKLIGPMGLASKPTS